MADRDDAALIVQLAQWATMMGLDEAILEIFGDDFDPPTASLGFAPVRRILQFGETVATLTKNNLLDEDLVLDWLWVSGLWNRVRFAAGAEREKHGVAELYENFEALAKRTRRS